MPDLDDLDDLDVSSQMLIWVMAVVLIILIYIVGAFLDALFVWMRGTRDTRKGALLDVLLQILFYGLVTFLAITSIRSLFSSCSPSIKSFCNSFFIPAIFAGLLLTQRNLISNIYTATSIKLPPRV